MNETNLETLDPEAFLDDTIMHSYLSILVNSNHVKKYDVEVSVLSSFILESLTKTDQDYEYCIKVGVKMRLLRQDLVLVPIFRNLHWSLLVINVKKKHLVYLGSLHINFPDVFSIFARYLCDLDRVMYKGGVNVGDWRCYRAASVPRQPNGYDCGIFVLHYAELICTGKYEPRCLHVSTKKREEIRDKIVSSSGKVEKRYYARVEVAPLSVRSTEKATFSESIPGGLKSWGQYLTSLIRTMFDSTFKKCQKGDKCRRPTECSDMVHCEKCREWYHVECIDVTQCDLEGDASYHCQACA